MRSKNTQQNSRFKKQLKKKNFFGLTNSSYKKKKIRLIKSLVKSTFDRHKNKNNFRKNNIIKINAFLSNYQIKYSEFINMLNKLNYKINKVYLIKILNNNQINNIFLDILKKQYNNIHMQK